MKTGDITIGIFGDESLIKSLGKKGNINDIALYSFEHTFPGGSKVHSFVSPKSEKITPLLQAIGMSDICVISTETLTKELGETIIAIDAAAIKQGFILTNSDEIKNQITQIIKGTNLEKYEFLPKDAEILKEKLFEIEIEKDENADVSVTIDNSFLVKSVGTVILGYVTNGTLKEHDELVVQPSNKDVTIKSIQSQDKNVKIANAGKRVGLSLKGAKVDELRRGFIITKKDSIKEGTKIALELKRNKYYKGDIKEGMKFSLNIGLQVIQAKIISIETVDETNYKLSVEAEKSMAYKINGKFIFAGDNTIPRIAGNGVIIENL
ncbi:MAG: hypothetical protein K0B02_02070 [DPANN group archaeon]|nr:hypothetical protein [DPANN group archaeon]